MNAENLYTYSPVTFIYETTIPPENQLAGAWNELAGSRSELGEMMSATKVPPLPHKLMLHSKWCPDEGAWHYVAAQVAPGQTSNPFDTLMTYADIRKMEYPDMATYVDGIVKGDAVQVADYIAACQAVKDAWSKTMEPMTMREYYVAKGILRG